MCAAEYYYSERAKLGHDPLREDADAEALWERIKDSKKPIGGILMDQTLIAGVGNIYRAEVTPLATEMHLNRQ
jgi:formamidopyrimidine-DNA glycosylase